MNKIEIFESGPKDLLQKPPLLFVHGACMGARCWTDGFLDYFGSAGFHAVALNLHGHGNSSSDKPLRKLCINDYVNDVAFVSSKIPIPPIVIGHSM